MHNKLSPYEEWTISNVTASPSVAPYDGFVTWNDSNSTSDWIKINNVEIVVEGTGGDHNSRQGTTFPMNKGDEMLSQRVPTHGYARWYNKPNMDAVGSSTVRLWQRIL